MDKTTLKTFVEEGLDCGSLNDTWFTQALNIAKTKIEEERDWQVLIKTDTSKTASSGDTFLTAKACPTDFSSDIAFYLLDGNSNPTTFLPIPYRNKYQYKDASYRYYVDYAANNFYLTGKNQGGTIALVYHSVSPEFAADDDEWIFPARFHAMLGFMVAVMFRGGSDYDTIAVQNAIQNNRDAKELWDAMLLWDDKLRAKQMNGQYEAQQTFDRDGFAVGDNTGFNLGNL